MHRSAHGTLSVHDPLHMFLAEDVLCRVLGSSHTQPVFDVQVVHPVGVLRVTERHTGVDLAAKFFIHKRPADQRHPPPEYFRTLLRREFENLQRLRQLGFDRSPYRVARPLAINDTLDYVLVEEFVSGVQLDAVIHAALVEGRHAQLADRLTDLAGFLASLHRCAPTARPVEPQLGLAYLNKVLHQLTAGDVITPEYCRRLQSLRAQWAALPILASGSEALIHGDATPVNFVFPADREVVAIDLERLAPGDPAADVGCVAAELRHAAFRTTGDPNAVEPLVQHFYARYAAAYDLDHAAFTQLTTRGRFWMGVMELRIARNDWLDLPYRRQLVAEAERCLLI